MMTPRPPIEWCHRCDEFGVETPATGGILCDACRADVARHEPIPREFSRAGRPA